VKVLALVGGPGDGQQVTLRDEQTWLTLIVRFTTVDRMNPFGPRGVPSYDQMPYEEHRYEETETENGGHVLTYKGTVERPSVHADGPKRLLAQDVPASLLERLRIKIKGGKHD
jgi:hypothetical protein